MKQSLGPIANADGARLDFLYLGVFFTFAPVGFLIAMILSPPGGWLVGIISATMAGMSSVAWCYCFQSRKWWILAPLIAAQMLVPPYLFRYVFQQSLFQEAGSASPTIRLITLATLAVLSTIAGYIYIVRFARHMHAKSIRMKTELNIAQRVHQAMVPDLHLSTSVWEIFGRSLPSSEMGGDLIDVVGAAGDGRIDVLLGDVSGHGVGAGIVMAMLKGSVRTRLRRGDDLGAILTDVNAVLTDLTEPQTFATFAAATLGHQAGTVEFTLAGHLPILVVRPDGCERIENQHLPLGIVVESEYSSIARTVKPGDVVVLLTDGMTEVQNARGKELTLDAACRIVEIEVRRGGDLREIHARVMQSVDAHGPRLDDQSLILIRAKSVDPG